MPDSIAIQMADVFGGDIDFLRDLRKGDHFSVGGAVGNPDHRIGTAADDFIVTHHHGPYRDFAVCHGFLGQGHGPVHVECLLFNHFFRKS